MTEQEALTFVETLLHSANPKQGLNDVQSAVFIGTWAGYSYKDIAQKLNNRYRYSYESIKQVGSQLWKSLSKILGERVTKGNLQSVLRRYQESQTIRGSVSVPAPSSMQDWGEAIDVSLFHGRQRELQTLETWILEDCRAIAKGSALRAIAILGLGGMGKTALSVKLAQQLQSQFDHVIWRSLQQAPPLTTLINEILPILAGSKGTTDNSIAALMEQLHAKRCLLILDNIESILQSGNRSGQYQSGYEAYLQLIERICDEPHQSCLIITGREKPGGFALREGKNLPVRSLQLQGLSGTDGQQILIAKGLDATDSQQLALVKYFGGNPLALKIAATTIQTLFGGNIQAFLAQGSSVFSDLWDLLEQQFNRLSPLQQQIMYWLAINREGVTPAKLQNEILPKVLIRELLEALESLQARSLIETADTGLTQQPVIMEYVTECFIQTIEQEIITGNLNLFKTHALIEAQTQDYVRDAQIQLILQPLSDRLLTHFLSQAQLEAHLCQILASLQYQTAAQIGYGAGNLLNLFCYLKTDLTGFDFSHLVIRQAYLANATLHDVDFSNSQISQTVFAETFSGVTGVTYSPDGKRFATSDTKGDIQIWDTSTGEKLVRCRGHLHWTWAVAFSPDGQYLASAGDDYLVKLWDVETGQCLQTYQGHTYSVNAVAFSPDGQILASCSQDATIRLWRVASTTPNPEILTLVGHQGRVWSIAFSPDGQTLASAGEDCTIRLWDVATQICLKEWHAHERWVRSVAFSPDGEILASSSYDQTIKLWDVKTQECLKILRGHRQAVSAIAFSPNICRDSHGGLSLASSSFDRTIKLWDVTTGECLKTFLGHTNRVWTVAYHPNGQQLISGGDDHATKLWNIKMGRCTKTIIGHTNAVLSLALSPDGCYLASGHEDQTIRLWDIKNGSLIKTLREHTNRVWSLAFQPATSLGKEGQNNRLLASGSADYTIKLWDWKSGNCRQTLYGHNSWVWSIAFHRNGTQLASGSYDQTVKLWDIETGECLKTLQGHTSPVVRVVYSPDGKLLASCDFDGMIKLWDADTGECCQTIKGHTNSVWSVAFSPDGKWLLSASLDHTLKLWSVSTGECLRTLKGHEGGVTAAQFSPDHQFVVSGSLDHTLKVWDILTGQCYSLTGHSEMIHALLVASVQLENDAATLTAFSGSLDESIKVWDLPAQECSKTLSVSRPYEGMKVRGIQGLTEAQWGTLEVLGTASSSANLAEQCLFLAI
jgi:WD40 repeat protein